MPGCANGPMLSRAGTSERGYKQFHTEHFPAATHKREHSRTREHPLLSRRTIQPNRQRAKIDRTLQEVSEHIQSNRFRRGERGDGQSALPDGNRVLGCQEE